MTPEGTGRPEPFAITTPATTIGLGADRRGELAASITNLTGRALRVRLGVVPTAPAEAAWFAVDGEAERMYAAGETKELRVRIGVPATAPAGTYRVRCDAFAEDQPSEVFTEGPTVAVDVPAPAARRFPWWIVGVAAAGLIAVGILVAILVLRGGSPDLVAPAVRAPEEAAVIECDATPCPVPLAWDAVKGASTYLVRVGPSADNPEFEREVTGTQVDAMVTPSGPLVATVAARRDTTTGPAATRSFSAVVRLTAPTINAPAPNQTVLCAGPCPVTVSWTAVPGARDYEVLAHAGSATGTVAASGQVTGTTADLQIPFPGPYVLTVIARDGERRGPAAEQPMSVAFVRHVVTVDAVVNAQITIRIVFSDVTVQATSGPLRQGGELTQPGQRATVMDQTANIAGASPPGISLPSVRVVVEATLTQLGGPVVVDAHTETGGVSSAPVQFSVDANATAPAPPVTLEQSTGNVSLNAVTTISVNNAVG